MEVVEVSQILSTLMSDYTQRFAGKAADYARYRERYDPEVVLPVLREKCGLVSDWLVADVGAGTGMAGDLFRANGNRVIAIEPNADMRSACESLHERDPLFTVVAGTAETTGLPDRSVDLVAVGRALHWFDVDAFLHECRRVLKPQGWVVVLACGRTEDGRDENLAFKDILQEHTGRDSTRDPLLDVYRRLESFFAGGRFIHAEAGGTMHLDWEELRGLTLSLSHAPMPGSETFPAFESALQSYFDRFAQNRQVTLSTRTFINAGQFSDGVNS